MSQSAPYRKPGFFTLHITNPLAVLLGRQPILTVRGRTTGQAHSVPVWPLEYQSKRYLVAPRGNTQWARNLRVVGEGELRLGGRTSRFKATELPVADRGPLVAAYVERYGKRYGGFVAKEFAGMPDPADHPVFLLEASR